MWIRGCVFVSLDTRPLKMVSLQHIATNLYKSSYSSLKLDVIELPQSSGTSSEEKRSLLTLSVCDKQIYKFWNLKQETLNAHLKVDSGWTTWSWWFARKLEYVSNLLVFLYQFYIWTGWYFGSRPPFVVSETVH